MLFNGKRIIVFGGTGSLGKILLRRLLSGKNGAPDKVIIFSRDEMKHHLMRMDYLNGEAKHNEIFRKIVEFQIGDVRDLHSVSRALYRADIAVNAAALKQVPSCEYFVEESVKTNILGPCNIVKAITEHKIPVETVIGVSTDKACKPVNNMGMTKAIQEKVFTSANIHLDTKFVCVRYGNVLSSNGSVIPLFQDQITKGGPITLTSPDMTRFLMNLEEAVNVVIEAISNAPAGAVVVPLVTASKITDLANVMTEGTDIGIEIIGIRPGEKTHEILVSEEEAPRTVMSGKYIHILPSLPEVCRSLPHQPALTEEYSSKNNLMSVPELKKLLKDNDLL